MSTKKRWIPTFALVAVLQASPLVKQLAAPVWWLAGSAPVAAILRWVTAAAAAAGTFHAVSGASAAVVGLTKYTNNTPLGGPTNHAYGVVGQPFRYRITVTNAGSDHNKDYFNCLPLPPGLVINTNFGGNGFITNTPSVAGDYRVTLVAGNRSYPTPATYQMTITISPDPNAQVAPRILTAPSDATVLLGTATELTVTAEGSPPLSYQWRRDGQDLAGATNANYGIGAATSADAGVYTVRVSNEVTNVLSAGATLTVVEPPVLALERLGSNGVTGHFPTHPDLTYTIEYKEGSLGAPWQVLTNFSGPSGSESLWVSEPSGEAPFRVFRVRISLP